MAEEAVVGLRTVTGMEAQVLSLFVFLATA